MTPRQQCVSDFQLKIIFANIVFGGDLSKLEEWIANHSQEEVQMLEDAALDKQTINYLRFLKGSDSISLEPEK